MTRVKGKKGRKARKKVQKYLRPLKKRRLRKKAAGSLPGPRGQACDRSWSISAQHGLYSARDIGPAAGSQIALLGKGRRDVPKRHAVVVHLLRQQHHVGTRLSIRLAAAALARDRLLAVARGLELGHK